MIQIDGALGEGGGQILRSALTLSMLSGKPFQIRNIRARRTKPGMRPQHLEAVRAAAKISQAHVQGAAAGSQSLIFEPGVIKAGQFHFEIETAGATTLVLQTVLIPLCLAEGNSELTIRGGTHVPWSPCAEYLALAWLPILATLGFTAEITCEQAGFFPRGGGLLLARIEGGALAGPLHLTQRGELERLVVHSAIANLPAHVVERQARQARKRLLRWNVPVELQLREYKSLGQGSLLLIQPQFEYGHACFFALGERGKPSERVADEAVVQFEEFLVLTGAVDPYLADQILIPLSLGILPSQFTTSALSEHLRTNVSVVEAFEMADVEIEDGSGYRGQVSVHPKGQRAQAWGMT